MEDVNPFELETLCIGSLQRLQDAYVRSASLWYQLATDGGREYACRAITRRFKAIELSFDCMLNFMPPNRREPLDPEEVQLGGLYLNAIYSNVYGCIDNVAWTIAYEKGLIPDSLKSEDEHKFEIDLFKKKFQKQLKQVAPEFRAKVADYQEWYNEMSQFRHPGAHRVPLYIIPYRITEEELAEERVGEQRMQSEFSDYLQKVKNAEPISTEEMRRLQTQQPKKFGKFVPMFAHTVREDSKVYYLYPALRKDIESILDMFDCMVEFLGAQT